MDKDNINLLKGICSMTQDTLKGTMKNYLRSRYTKVLDVGSCLIAEGDIPIGLVAHMDTVFKTPPEEIFYDPKSRVMWSPQGLGADDRAGIYAIIQIIEKGYRPHIIFTTDEEIGGVGASNMVKLIKKTPFKKLKYLIELDRRGIYDSVFYDCDNKVFENYINRFGFKTDWGSFSDISVIAPQWGVAAVNLSIGYDSEHSQIEHLYMRALDRTIKKVCKMLKDVDSADYFKYIPVKRYVPLFNPYAKGTCDWCGEPLDKDSASISGQYGVMKLCKPCYDCWLQWDV